MMKSLMLAAIAVAAVIALPSDSQVLTGYTFACPGGNPELCVKTGEIKFKVRKLDAAEALGMLNDE